MGGPEHINETVETISMLIVIAIEQLKKKETIWWARHPRLLTKERKQYKPKTLSLNIASFSKNGMVLNKPSSGKNSYSIKFSITTEKIAPTPTRRFDYQER